MKNRRFPLFLDLTGRAAVVVGGGTVGLRRAKVLRDFGAAVTIVSPELSGGAPGIRHLARAYETGDLTGAFLALAATDDSTVNAAVEAEARSLGVFFNRSDSPEACDFFFPAICEGGGMVAGLAGDGSDHKKVAQTAKAIRAVMEQE